MREMNKILTGITEEAHSGKQIARLWMDGLEGSEFMKGDEFQM